MSSTNKESSKVIIMRAEKRTFRIGILAQKVGVEQFVIRFWEKAFGVRSKRSSGRQRLYTEEHLALFQKIKTLLYERGFTIAGAKEELSKQNTKTVVGSKVTTLNREPKKTPDTSMLSNEIVSLQKKLLQGDLILPEGLKKETFADD